MIPIISCAIFISRNSLAATLSHEVRSVKSVREQQRERHSEDTRCQFNLENPSSIIVAIRLYNRAVDRSPQITATTFFPRRSTYTALLKPAALV